MQIAPGVKAAEWQRLRLDDPASPDWGRAVEILRERIQRRFLDAVDYLISAEELKPSTERRFGFVILAIDCLLVETFGAFIEGLEDTDRKSKATFCKFLTTRSEFARDFTNKALAKQFYEEFRCGVLHQAEVGGESKIWSVGPLLQVDSGRITVNRSEFHRRLKADFETYLRELLDPANTSLRKNFRKKMDFISRI